MKAINFSLRKLFGVLFVLTLTLALLTACGGGGGTDNSSSGTTSTTGTTTTSGGGTTTADPGTTTTSTGTKIAPSAVGTIPDQSVAESGDLASPRIFELELSSTYLKDFDTVGYVEMTNPGICDSTTITVVNSTAADGTKSAKFQCTTTGISDSQSAILVRASTTLADGSVATADQSFKITITAQKTTLGAYLINEIGNHVANISGVSNGAHYLWIPVDGISTSLLTDAQIMDMLDISFSTDPNGNRGCTKTSVTDKANWVVDRANNRIRINYTVYDDQQADLFVAKKKTDSVGEYLFGVSGINF